MNEKIAVDIALTKTIVIEKPFDKEWFHKKILSLEWKAEELLSEDVESLTRWRMGIIRTPDETKKDIARNKALEQFEQILERREQERRKKIKEEKKVKEMNSEELLEYIKGLVKKAVEEQNK